MEFDKESFREEARELLDNLESDLVELEESSGNLETVRRIFRSLHTIKGSGAMYGFHGMADLAHELETVYETVRDGHMPVTPQLVSLTLEARDQLENMLGGGPDGELGESLKKSLKEILPPETGKIKEKSVSGVFTTYRIRFIPDENLFADGTNPMGLLDELRELGECGITGQGSRIPLLTDMAPEACYLYWDIVLTTSADENEIRDIFIFVEDNCTLNIDIIEEHAEDEDIAEPKRIGEILVGRGDISPCEIEDAHKKQRLLGEILIESEKLDKGIVDSALAEQKHIRRLREKAMEMEMRAGIKVSAGKLDGLINLVGEILTVQAQITLRATEIRDRKMAKLVKVADRLTGCLRENAMSIRMLPIGTGFGKFKRLVRDLSNELGKKAVLATEGGETELDKTVLDRLNEPMVHIIRNMLDHGIESPGMRKALNKPDCGVIRISAEYRDAGILIRISDDGGGIDFEKIRSKAVALCKIPANSEPDREELINLVFAPGFSTAGEITGISGRGMGMDVVKRTIEDLRGSVSVSSTPGAGTEFTLKLPLTLAIIDGLLVRIADDSFIIPLLAVEECIDLAGERAGQTVAVRGELVPYIDLREMFEIEGKPPSVRQIVIARANGHRVGFLVDEVAGDCQTVLKPLGKAYQNVEGFSGATIMADGTVGLILDLNKLYRLAEIENS